MNQPKLPSPACPVCGSHNSVSSYFRNGAERIRGCRSCSAAFVYPRLMGTELLSQYSSGYFEEKYESLRESEYLNMESWCRKIQLCLERVSRIRAGATGDLLDIGCGKGWFLEAAQERGWRVKGLELCRDVARQTEKRLGVPVFEGSVFDVPLPEESFDLVTMFDVIEHLERPLEAMQICHRILRPEGVLLVGTPNLRGLGCRLLGARAFGIWPDEHIVYFGPAAMARALRAARFSGTNILTREIYPENATAILAWLSRGQHHSRKPRGEIREEVRSVKNRFRRNSLLRGLREAVNRVFTSIPLGDELLAFAIKSSGPESSVPALSPAAGVAVAG